MTSPAGTPRVRALPIRPRPAAGDTPATYTRRLARANHLRPAYLNRYLRDDATGQISIDMLAALAARPVSSLMRAFSQADQVPPAKRRYFTASQRRELFQAIRRDTETRHRSIRALADDYGIHRRVVRQALASPGPRPRKPPRPRPNVILGPSPLWDVDDITQKNAHRHLPSHTLMSHSGQPATLFRCAPRNCAQPNTSLVIPSLPGRPSARD